MVQREWREQGVPSWKIPDYAVADVASRARPMGEWSVYQRLSSLGVQPQRCCPDTAICRRLQHLLLDRVDVNDLKKFFLRWYGPNNATLTVGGDVNPKEVVKMVEKYYGVIPRGLEVLPMKLDPVVLDKNRYVSYVDKNIRYPGLFLSFPTIGRHHPDEAPLDCLADILGSGQSSFLFKKFVLTNKIISCMRFWLLPLWIWAPLHKHFP